MAAPAMQSASALVLTSNRPSLGVVDARQDSTLMTSDRGVAAQSTAVLGGWRQPELAARCPSAADLHRLAQRQRTSCPTTPRDDLRKRSRTNDSVGRRSAADESSWASKRTGMGGGRRLFACTSSP
ncbi:hypothetical protein BJ912DRAFT_1144005 [Pholiota molesta]|nr:hypothetical protein BJ912DRAFT_1144005 [Pholiota molesta]